MGADESNLAPASGQEAAPALDWRSGSASVGGLALAPDCSASCCYLWHVPARSAIPRGWAGIPRGCRIRRRVGRRGVVQGVGQGVGEGVG